MQNARALLHLCDVEPRTRLDAAIAALAARQHGRVSRRQLFALGLGRGAIEVRLREGRLHEIHRGVYAVGHAASTQRADWMSAVLAGGEGAALSHGPAAALWSIREQSSGPISVTVPRRLHSRNGLRFRSGILPPDEVTVRDGIPVTTVPRTIFDLAADLDRRAVERAIHEAQVQRLYDRLSLHDLVARYPNRPGIATIKAVLATQRESFDYTRNEFEERFRTFLIRYGLPVPSFNEWLFIAGRWMWADGVWHAQRVVVELDGRGAHETDQAFEADRLRDRKLTIAGWTPIRVTWRQLHHEQDDLAGDLRTLL